ncbi:MAG TPA: methyltransferase [Candidatus Dormibacteraeota bacterium]|nr:methyltransferase [Candidatus Dormibacteraeota bacterium]
MATASLSLRDDPTHVAQLRSALWSAGYNTGKVSEMLGADGQHLQPDPAQAVLLRRQLPAGKPLSTLIQLFILTLPVSRHDAAAALAPLSLDSARQLGLVQEFGDHVEGAVRITPYERFLFASSRVPDMDAVERDHVMGITRSSINLANLTIRRPVDLTLDLGCGTGFQSLFASRHSSKVIATDINPLAIRFTRFNARLNAVDNIECREGSFMEPVAGEQFDLIVSNPPFVISPDTNFLFRDSGLPGDDLSRQVLADVAGALREGGMATVLISWGRKTGEGWADAPRRWVEGNGCDAWILHQITQPALMHSASWHQQLAPVDLAAYDRGVGRWTEYINGLGFDAIAYGAVILRRRHGANWIRTEDLPDPTAAPAGEHLLRMTEAEDLLAAMPDKRSLLDLKLTLARSHRLDQALVCTDGSYTVEQAVLHLTEGLPFRANVDAFNAYLVTRLDGTRTLREAIAEAAGAATPGVEIQELEAAALRSVRRMVELGFLLINGSK